jgi:hypothetical protein
MSHSYLEACRTSGQGHVVKGRDCDQQKATVCRAACILCHCAQGNLQDELNGWVADHDESGRQALL